MDKFLQQYTDWLKANPIAFTIVSQHSEHYKQLISLVGKKKAYQWAVNQNDEYTANISAEEKFQYSCKKGCAFCCHQAIHSNPQEVEIIKEYCKINGISINKAHLIQQSKIPSKKLPYTDVSACVFLKDNLCSIYEARPITCRNYSVVSPAEDCNIKNGKKETRLTFHAERFLFIAAVTLNHDTGLLHQLLLKQL